MMRAIFETAFDVAYLVSVITIGILMVKKAKGEKLEKYERTFYRENKKLVDFEKRYSEEELQEQERLKALLG